MEDRVQFPLFLLLLLSKGEDVKMNKLVCKTKWFLKRNGSTILTIGGAAGVIATAVVAVKETPKALYLLEQVREEKGEELTTFCRYLITRKSD